MAMLRVFLLILVLVGISMARVTIDVYDKIGCREWLNTYNCTGYCNVDYTIARSFRITGGYGARIVVYGQSDCVGTNRKMSTRSGPCYDTPLAVGIASIFCVPVTNQFGYDLNATFV